MNNITEAVGSQTVQGEIASCCNADSQKNFRNENILRAISHSEITLNKVARVVRDANNFERKTGRCEFITTEANY